MKEDSPQVVRATAPIGSPAGEARRLAELSPQQWKTGAAAWLGWCFDGLDMHLYTLVAVTFVAHLLHTEQTNPDVGYYSSLIQAAFLIGWAVGGAFFGRIGDLIGRSRALMLTILTYAMFTALAYFAQTWWQLLIFRFIAALGIGGEWAVGAALLSETWPKRWRPWMAAGLQTAVNIGTMMASLAVFLLADFHPRNVFLVGVLPALLVLWIRRAVPEPEEWHRARNHQDFRAPPFADLFRGSIRGVTILSLLVCTLTLTGHWAFMFWCPQHLRGLAAIQGGTNAQGSALASEGMVIIMLASIAGNILAAVLAKCMGYRRTIAVLCAGYFCSLFGAYVIARDWESFWPWLIAIGICQGIFALFTMYLPPLFPTLLRTTGAGFCYNFGRIAAALGTVFFGLFSSVGDFRLSILYAAFLFLPAAVLAWKMPDLYEPLS